MEFGDEKDRAPDPDSAWNESRMQRCNGQPTALSPILFQSLSDAMESSSPPPSSDPETCQNCGTTLVGEYCHGCGQRHVPALRVRHLVRRFFESALDLEDLEQGLGQTFLHAAQNPGRVARRYVEGQRKQFVNPIGYFLLTATITFLVFLAFRETWVQGQAQVYESMWQSMGTDPSQVFQAGSPLRSTFGWTSAQELAGSMFDWFQQLQTYVGILTCVLAGLLLRWTMPNRTFTEIFVFELYVTAQATLFLGLIGPLCFWSAPALIGGLPLLLQTGLHAHGGKVFFGSGEKAILLPVLAYLASIIVLLLGSSAIMAGLVVYIL